MDANKRNLNRGLCNFFAISAFFCGYSVCYSVSLL